MYAKCGQLVKAQDVFDNLLVRSIVSYSVLITGYCLNGYGEEALPRFEKMQQEGIFPNAVTLASILKARGSIRETRKGREIHAEIARRGLWEVDCVLDNSLIEMYMKCNALTIAHELFNELSVRNLVSWNAMLSAYGERGQYTESLRLYTRMEKEGVCPTDITLLCILQACGETGNLEICKRTHYTMISSGLDLHLSLVNILIHAYASCGCMQDARNVLDGLPQPKVVSWNACLCGYAGEGDFVEIMKIFDSMQMAGLKPDEVTFTSVLSACNHTGLLSMALKIFETMSRYRFEVDLLNEHQTHFSPTQFLLNT